MIIRCLLFILLTSTGVILPGNKVAREMTRADREILVRRYAGPDGSEQYDKFDKDGGYTHCIISIGKEPHVRCVRVTLGRLQWRDIISNPDEGRESKSEGRVVFGPKESLTILEGLKTTYAQQDR